ncbi:MAG: cupin domain-containing protein [Actinomycetota bacterium]
MASTLGSRLKAARTDRGASLREVAAGIGVSAALISQIELGHTQPSVSTLYSLVTFFGISLDRVMGIGPERLTPATAAPLSPSAHLAVAARPTLAMGNGVRWELVASTPGNSAEAVLVTYEPGASSSSDGSLMTHSGREDAYLVAGELTLKLDESVAVIRVGDSFSFDSARPHRFFNAGDHPACGIWLKVKGEV